MNLHDNDARTAREAREHAQWIALAPFVFQAARALRDTGILSEIEKARIGLTLEEVADRTKLSHYGARVLLEAGLGVGLVTEDEARRYHLTKTAHFLLHDGMTRANMDFAHDVTYQGLFYLDEAVRTGKPAGLKVFGERWSTIYEALAKLPESVRRSWFAFNHYYSDLAFPAALSVVFRRKPKRLLDVGGNTGKWAELCLRHDPGVEVTLMDLPGQLDAARDTLRTAGLEARIRYYEANLLDPATAVPAGYDAIWMSQFLDCFSETEITSILSRCAAALPPSARLYILEPFWDRQRFSASSFCQQMISLYFTVLANGNSQIYRSDVFLRCVAQAGFEVEEEFNELGVSHTLLVCRVR